MGLATAAQLPVVVVGDIDRGGVFAALYGTVALMPPADQRLVAGFLVNKFRGDVRLLAPGLDSLSALTGRPTFGVLPWRSGLDLDVEDSLGIGRARSGGPPHGEDVLRVSVARLPRLSNVTDLDALAAEPGVLVRYATAPEELADADLVVLPGSRATVADLAWLRSTGLADGVLRHAAAGGAVLGVCGGHQMLARTITDDVESGAGTVPGLGLLPADVRFAREKTLARPVGEALGEPVHGYEIHHGVVTVDADAEPFLDGARTGAVFGTTWHGALENDGFRRAFLGEVARIAGRRFVPAPDTSFAAVREARLDVLGDLVEEHADTDALWRLVEDGAPPGLPLLPPGATAR
jgi:adenosylcobyric acid synthase